MVRPDAGAMMGKLRSPLWGEEEKVRVVSEGREN
jgi:hypothetical protein